MNKNIKRFFSVLSLSLLSITALTGCGKKQESVQPEQDFYNVYNLAVEAGYNGDYASWLASIKGEKGDPGIGIESIVFKEVKNGQSIFTVTFSNNTTNELAILNGKDGEKGPQGEKGEDGKPGLPGESLYETFVNECGYVGTKEEFLRDHASNMLGYKKEHKISISYGFTSERHGKNLTPIVTDKVYKNGEKVTINTNLIDLDFYKLHGVYEDGNLLDYEYIEKYPTKINENDYRAHKDTDLVILYDTLIPKITSEHYMYEDRQCINYDLFDKGIKLNFEFLPYDPVNSNNYIDYIPMEDKVISKLKGVVNHTEPENMKLSYDAATKTLKSSVPGTATITLLANSTMYELTFAFLTQEEMDQMNSNPALPDIYIEPYCANQLKALEVGNLMDLFVLSEYNHYNLSLKNNSGIIEIYNDDNYQHYKTKTNIYTVKPGTDILLVKDPYTDTVINEYPITVYEKGQAPEVEMINDLSFENTYFECGRPQNLYVRIPDKLSDVLRNKPKNITFTKEDGTPANVEIINKEYQETQYLFNEGGNITIRAEVGGHYCEQIVKVEDNRKSFTITAPSNLNTKLYQRSHYNWEKFEQIDPSKKTLVNEVYVVIDNPEKLNYKMQLSGQSYENHFKYDEVNNVYYTELYRYNFENINEINITITKDETQQ